MTLTRRALLKASGGMLFAPPRFPDRNFYVTKSRSVRDAIGACMKAGGGRIVVPEGTWATGPIHLTSNMNLHLERGATLKFSNNPSDYLPVVFTRFEGTECMNYSPLIYAFGQTNVGVTGEGTLDGQADAQHWWPWKKTAKRKELVAMADKDVPVAKRVFGEGGDLRPMFVQFYRCANVLIDGVTIVNSPMWELHPVLSKNVIVRNVNIDTHGPNNDGCDPESCSDVLIEGCTFNTGDDCIAIKSGRNQDGRRVGVACENVTVRGCTMKDGHGGVSIGSEVSGNVRNVLIENCHMDSPHLDRALRLKSNSYRGGIIENVTFRNSQVGQVAQAVLDIDFFYEEGEGGPYPPTVRGVTLENITCGKSKRAIFLRGYKTDPIRNVQVKNCRFENTSEPDFIENAVDISLPGRERGA